MECCQCAFNMPKKKSPVCRRERVSNVLLFGFDRESYDWRTLRRNEINNEIMNASNNNYRFAYLYKDVQAPHQMRIPFYYDRRKIY